MALFNSLKKIALSLKPYRKSFFISFFIPVMLIFILIVLLPLFFLRQNLQIEMHAAQVENELKPFFIRQKDTPDWENLSQKLLQLKTEEMFLQSQLQLVKSDSVNLSIDLSDSVVALLIRGAKARECKIHQFKASRGFKHLKANASVLGWLSNAFISQKEGATIPKAPIKIRMAPKDTSEAARFKSKPISVENPDVHYTIQFDRNLMIEINQIESPSFVGRMKRLIYDLKLNSNILMQTVVSLIHRQPPQIPLWINLELSRNDIKAIYRALPRHAGMALRL